MLRVNLPLWLGVALAAGFLLLCTLPAWLAIRDPHVAQITFWADGQVLLTPLKPGEAGFLLGTDRLGRDIVARVVYGARTTLLTAGAITALRAIIGIPLGLWAGWNRGMPGAVTRTLGLSLGVVPTLVVATITLGGLRYMVADPGAWFWTYCTVMVVLGLFPLAEQIRRRTEQIAVEPYVEAAISVGARPSRIIRRHILPHLREEIFAAVASDIGWTVLVLGQLAVLGVFVGGSMWAPFGNMRPVLLEYTPELGQMLGANISLLRTHPWVPGIPAVVLGLAAATCPLVAEGVRQARHGRSI